MVSNLPAFVVQLDKQVISAMSRSQTFSPAFRSGVRVPHE
jgi:hypothetical protein